MEAGRRFLWVAALTFTISVLLGFASKGFVEILNLPSGFLVLFLIVLIGIVADVVGVAATAAREEPFHAMAVDKVSGAQEGIWLVRHADRVATFTNDVIGDVTGTLSGALTAALVVRLVVLEPSWNEALLSTLLLALVAAFTVGGKAYAKTIAIRQAHDIVFLVARIVSRTQNALGVRWMVVGNDRSKRRRAKNRAGGKNLHRR